MLILGHRVLVRSLRRAAHDHQVSVLHLQLHPCHGLIACGGSLRGLLGEHEASSGSQRQRHDGGARHHIPLIVSVRPDVVSSIFVPVHEPSRQARAIRDGVFHDALQVLNGVPQSRRELLLRLKRLASVAVAPHLPA